MPEGKALLLPWIGDAGDGSIAARKEGQPYSTICGGRSVPFPVPFALPFPVLCLSVVLLLFLLPGKAFAYFNEVADSYPAAQELGSYGRPISGSELPDGAYKVGARTTSRMCILYTNPNDAEARDSKEQAIITVNNGAISAVFYISKAYTHLYLGTQEQAAAATDASGTDASAYIAGDPDEGYVPHMFALSVPALNSPMTVSTFSGGDRGVEAGRWYTRQVVFTMTDAELQEILAANGSDASSDPETEDGSSRESMSASDEPSSAPVLSAAGEGGSAGRSGQGSAAVSESVSADDGGNSVSREPDSARVSQRGVLLDFARSNGEVVSAAAVDAGQTEAENVSIPPQVVLGFALVCLLAAGAGLRMVRFRRSYEGAPAHLGGR